MTEILLCGAALYRPVKKRGSMISEKLTEEFIENHYFVLDKSYSVKEYDECGWPTGGFINFESGSEWEITNDSYLDGNILLNGLTYTVWIEISE